MPHNLQASGTPMMGGGGGRRCLHWQGAVCLFVFCTLPCRQAPPFPTFWSVDPLSPNSSKVYHKILNHAVCVQASGSPMMGGGGGSFAGIGSVPPYTLAHLHVDLNRWPAAYYSKQVCSRYMCAVQCRT